MRGTEVWRARLTAAEICGADVLELAGQAHQAIDYAPEQIVQLVLEFDR